MHPANKPRKNATWHLIGAQVGQLRRAAGLTQPELAEQVSLHIDTIASVEQGRRPLKYDLAQQLDQVLDARGVLAVAVSRVPERERYPAFAQDFVEHEQQALTLLSYQNQVVPGQLQTEEYAAAVFSCLFPPISPEEAEERLSARLDRHKFFDRKPWPPMMNFIIEESILHRPIGGRAVLREQIRHLRHCAELPYMAVQIMPTAREKHSGLAGPMVLLETPDHDQLAYIEGQRVSFLVDDPDEVSVLQQKYGMLRSQALTPEESMGLLDDLAGES
ncbi:helix-turn-helix domain-containing protein [Streptomyces sp. SP18CS02]|uniref:helix-turn-helix domain-containing protein n=1 Tax=Streptomyces sp. SP18CS02 TaxID=3002531 RepID=UPI002E7AA33A|nr:helix-turn-helix transcriptional regulator [Streptomyces sp. SP18CS02]MEE1757010.1 helix-turn-helix transcriptional regulator [Streptomyces sp. SP18CS02]